MKQKDLRNAGALDKTERKTYLEDVCRAGDSVTGCKKFALWVPTSQPSILNPLSTQSFRSVLSTQNYTLLASYSIHSRFYLHNSNNLSNTHFKNCLILHKNIPTFYLLSRFLGSKVRLFQKRIFFSKGIRQTRVSKLCTASSGTSFILM